jgi:hypothetical protein
MPNHLALNNTLQGDEARAKESPMKHSKTAVLVVGALALSLLVAAFGLKIDAHSATEVIEFDPASIAINENRPVLEAACEATIAVPRPGAFKCTFEQGGVGDPCFVIADNTLICGPNPVLESYQAVVTTTDPLPAGSGSTGDPFAFYLDLGAHRAPCARRSEPFIVGGHMVTYGCQSPGVWIVGEPDTSGSRWSAQFITTDVQATQVTRGPVPSVIVRAWVHDSGEKVGTTWRGQ